MIPITSTRVDKTVQSPKTVPLHYAQTFMLYEFGVVRQIDICIENHSLFQNLKLISKHLMLSTFPKVFPVSSASEILRSAWKLTDKTPEIERTSNLPRYTSTIPLANCKFARLRFPVPEIMKAASISFALINSRNSLRKFDWVHNESRLFHITYIYLNKSFSGRSLSVTISILS